MVKSYDNMTLGEFVDSTNYNSRRFDICQKYQNKYHEEMTEFIWQRFLSTSFHWFNLSYDDYIILSDDQVFEKMKKVTPGAPRRA